ncbi:MAG: hypothetical protein H0T97_01050 [Actinobacteria bacterium]|nr:hypothetical protein [Actinomycetota bacterium]
MGETRQKLQELLEEHYRSCGWKPIVEQDGTVRASGVGGVTWIGLPIIGDDLVDPDFEARLLRLSGERMPRGELCPLELLPDEPSAPALRSLVERLRLRDRGNVEIYSLAA